MKKILFNIFMILAVCSAAYSQLPPESKGDAELTEDEAKLRIQDYQGRVNTLQAQYDSLSAIKTTSNQQLEQIRTDMTNCRAEILRLVGVTEADVNDFRQRIGVIEGKIRSMQGLSDSQLAERQDEVADLNNQINALRSNKITVLPEFYNKIIAMARDTKGLVREKVTSTYTVGTWAEDRDCLWNIAAKPAIYNDPLLWPVIWYANRDQIRNPDIIFPGQVLQIPPQGQVDPEVKKMERRYYRQKREAQETATPAETQQ